MKGSNEKTVHQFWAYELGLSSGYLTDAPQVSCTVQQLYSGVQIFLKENRVVVATPPGRVEAVQRAVANVSPSRLFSVDYLAQLFGDEVEKIVGPAEVNYADNTTFRPCDGASARTLSSSDSAAYCSFTAALSPDEIADSGFSADAFPAFGAFDDENLCAVASYVIWKPSIAHIKIASHPKYRRRGFAKQAVTALAADASDRGLILQWRALTGNIASLSLAAALGFGHYCSTIYVRFRSVPTGKTD